VTHRAHEVGSSMWAAFPTLHGLTPPDGTPPGNSVDFQASIEAAAFAGDITSSTGDALLSTVDPSAPAATPVVIPAGGHATVTVTLRRPVEGQRRAGFAVRRHPQPVRVGRHDGVGRRGCGIPFRVHDRVVVVAVFGRPGSYVMPGGQKPFWGLAADGHHWVDVTKAVSCWVVSGIWDVVTLPRPLVSSWGLRSIRMSAPSGRTSSTWLGHAAGPAGSGQVPTASVEPSERGCTSRAAVLGAAPCSGASPSAR